MKHLQYISTKHPDLHLRFAQPQDAALVLQYIQKLGDYQNMRDKVTATEENLAKRLADKSGEVIFAEYQGETIAFLYFFENSSAFIGEKGLFIDAFYMDESVRFQGFGKVMLSFLSKLALERSCERLEWACLDWNTPSIAFYQNMGAYSMDMMTTYRLTPEKLREHAQNFEG